MEEAMKRLMENSGGAEAVGTWTWFEKVFPPADNMYKWLEIAGPYVVAGAGVVVLVMLFRLCCCGGGGGGREKMMKAPGRNYRMPRSGFEGNPKGYFRNLRARK